MDPLSSWAFIAGIVLLVVMVPVAYRAWKDDR